MSITRFYLPTRFIIGAGSLTHLGKETAGLGKTAMIVCGAKSMHRTGVLAKVIKDLQENGVKTTIFDKVESNPRVSTIDEGAKLARDNSVQVIIGLGGGSAMDTAKCIALASSSSESIWAHYERKVINSNSVPAIILVPTVAASGSEANNGAVLTNWQTHEKVVLTRRQMYPTISIVDPALTITVPAKSTAQGGVDIFCHLVEAYITIPESTMINDSLRESSMRTTVESLPVILTNLDNIDQRSRLSWASTIACSQFADIGGGGGIMSLHGIEHPLSGEYDITHGDGLAALLIAWMKYTYIVRKERFMMLGQRVFNESDGIIATEKWLRKVGMSIKLKDLGVKEADFDKLANNAIRTAPWIKYHPNKLDSQAIRSIYQNSYQ